MENIPLQNKVVPKHHVFPLITVHDFKDWGHVAIESIRLLWNQYLMKDVPMLSFTTLTSLVPVMALLFVLLHGLGFDDVYMSWTLGVFKSQPVVAEKVIVFVKNYMANTDSYAIVIVGVISMMLALYSLMLKIEHTINAIWKSKERNRLPMIRDYFAVFGFFALMILSSSTLTIISLYIDEAMDEFRLWNYIEPINLFIMAPITMIASFMFVFWFIPHTYVNWKKALFPAFVSSGAMYAFQWSFVFVQDRLSGNNLIYGSLAALPIFMIWIECTWSICLWGFIACYMNQNKIYKEDYIDFDELQLSQQISICALLMKFICLPYKQDTEPYSIEKLHSETNTSKQLVSQGVKKLISVGLVRECDSDDGAPCYVPTQDSSNITYAKFIEKYWKSGLDNYMDDVNFSSATWKQISNLNESYMAEVGNIQITDL